MKPDKNELKEGVNDLINRLFEIMDFIEDLCKCCADLGLGHYATVLSGINVSLDFIQNLLMDDVDEALKNESIEENR